MVRYFWSDFIENGALGPISQNSLQSAVLSLASKYVVRQIKIIHMARHLNSRNLCQIVTWLDD